MRRRLLVALTLVLMSSLASAGSSSEAKPADLVNDKLVNPLVAKERDQSRFSRARLPPSERRVRVLDEKPQQDTSGNAFFAFAVDARHGWSHDATWNENAITGCVYPSSGEVFIRRGDAFHPAAAAIGKKTKAAPEGTCHAAARLGKL